MANIRIELNRAGVRDMLRSDEMMDICQGYASSALASLGDGYSVSTHTGKNRVNAEVKAVTRKAKKENLESNSILKAVIGC